MLFSKVDFICTLLKLKAGISFLLAAAKGMTPGVGPTASIVRLYWLTSSSDIRRSCNAALFCILIAGSIGFPFLSVKLLKAQLDIPCSSKWANLLLPCLLASRDLPTAPLSPSYGPNYLSVVRLLRSSNSFFEIMFLFGCLYSPPETLGELLSPALSMCVTPYSGEKSADFPIFFMNGFLLLSSYIKL